MGRAFDPEQVLRGRIARVYEQCWTRRGFFHPNVASWEYEWIVTWMERSPLVLSAPELEHLAGIERAVLGAVH